MHEIIFRGKRVSNGEWYEGVDVMHKTVRGELCLANVGEDWVRVIPETLGQYTGLIDKNGRKIFEGDIINYKGALAKVIYSTENAGFYALFSSWDTDLRALSAGKYVSVTGNIYDNPELLEGGNENG